MDQLKKLFSSLTLRQQISLLVAAVAVGAAFYGISHWNRERDFRPLYTSLTSEDAGQVVARLRDSAVDYRLTDGGATVLVPSAQVAEMRLQLAASGLPQSGRMGFELFDQTNFGTTQFVEQVNYHRALEGELERSVTALVEVERARVHITLAKESVFLESRSPAKASVMIQLRTGRKLAPQNVQAITYLVSSAVESLEPRAVSVLDMRGNLLSRSRTHGGLDAAEPSDALLDYRHSIEKNLLAKIGSTLEPLLGADGFRAGVSVECDFSSGEQSEEIFDPESSVMTTSQRTEDVAGTYTATGGIPGTASALPRPVSKKSARGNDGHSRRTENVAYLTSRTVRHTRLPQGEIKRISVSLLLDHEVHWEGTGEDARRTLVPPSEEKLRAIRELISGAVGLNAERGDQLIVEALPFESTRNWQPPALPPPATPENTIPLPAWLQELIPNQKMLAIVGAGAVLGMLLVGVAAVLILKRRRGRKVKSVTTKKRLSAAMPAAGEDDEESTGVESKMKEKLAEQAALKARLEQEALSSLKLGAVKTKKAEVLTKHISDEAQSDPMAMAQLMRTWLNEEGE